MEPSVTMRTSIYSLWIFSSNWKGSKCKIRTGFFLGPILQFSGAKKLKDAMFSQKKTVFLKRRKI